MNIKGGLVILLMIVLSFVFTRYYLCKIRGFCDENKEATVEIIQDSTNLNPTALLYSWGNIHPNIDSSFFNFIDSTIKSTPSGNAFVIVGDYFEREKNMDSSIGFKRANAIRNLLGENYDTTRIVARSNNFSIGDTTDEILFSAIHYESEILPAKVNKTPTLLSNQEEKFGNENSDNLAESMGSSNEIPITASNSRVEQGENEMSVFFASGPADKTITKEIQKAINIVANDLRLSKGSVLVSGFADPNGNQDVNLGLALKRADLIKQALIRQGIDEKKIIIESIDFRNTRSTGYNQRKVVIKKL